MVFNEHFKCSNYIHNLDVYSLIKNNVRTGVRKVNTTARMYEKTTCQD